MKLSICPRKQHFTRRRLPCYHTFTRCAVVGERYAADSRFRLVLDLFFRCCCAIPVSHNEIALFDLGFELVVGLDADGTFFAQAQCFPVDIFLNINEQLLDARFYPVARHGFFFERIAAHQFDGVVFEVATAHS